MSLSMYQASSPVFIRQLKALADVLGKGQAFATEHGLNPAELLEARLAPDMFPLPRQIQIATDGAKGAVARLAGVTHASMKTAALMSPKGAAHMAKAAADALKDSTTPLSSALPES